MSSDWKTKVTPTVKDVDRTPVAQDILCFNSKEGCDTWHVVVNHDSNGYVDRVQCKMTGVIRKYKRKNPAPRKVVSRGASAFVRKKPSAPSLVLEEEWFNGVKAWGDKVVRDYAADKSFEKGEVFSHPNFGKGVVQNRRDNKIDVLFKVGIKTLHSAK